MLASCHVKPWALGSERRPLESEWRLLFLTVSVTAVRQEVRYEVRGATGVVRGASVRYEVRSGAVRVCGRAVRCMHKSKLVSRAARSVRETYSEPPCVPCNVKPSSPWVRWIEAEWRLTVSISDTAVRRSCPVRRHQCGASVWLVRQDGGAVMLRLPIPTIMLFLRSRVLSLSIFVFFAPSQDISILQISD